MTNDELLSLPIPARVAALIERGCEVRPNDYSETMRDLYMQGIYVGTVEAALTVNDYGECADCGALVGRNDQDAVPAACPGCDGRGWIAAYGTGDQAGGWAETCPDCGGG